MGEGFRTPKKAFRLSKYNQLKEGAFDAPEPEAERKFPDNNKILTT